MSRRFRPLRSLVILAASASILAACQGPPANRKRVRSEAELEAERKALAEAAAARLAADAPPPAEVIPKGRYTKVGPMRGACSRTVCFAGPGELTEPPNRHLSESCRMMGGVIKRCEGGSCVNVWPTSEWPQILDTLVSELDGDGDGRVDEGDPECAINLVGWSEGATFAAVDATRSLREDGRISDAREGVDRMVLVAPYRSPLNENENENESEGESGAAPALEIPSNVAKAWIYRHTKSPAEDCSLAWAVDGEGPRLSPAPACAEGTQCWDYDYSYEPELAFVGREGARSGAVIGHCSIVAVVAKVAPMNINRGLESYAPYLPRFSDGRESGRATPEGPTKPPNPAG